MLNPLESYRVKVEKKTVFKFAYAVLNLYETVKRVQNISAEEAAAVIAELTNLSDYNLQIKDLFLNEEDT